MNELIDSWEDGAGIRQFIVLTAGRSDAQLEAVSTVRTEQAQLCTYRRARVSTTGRNCSRRMHSERAGELATSLLLHIAPELVKGDAILPEGSESGDAFVRGARRATPERAGDLYHSVLERILHLVDTALSEV